MNKAIDKPSFAILLAAYNGTAWIEEQIDSILRQRDVSVKIYISVDLSTDDTCFWCRSLAFKESRVVVLPSAGRFGGAAKNFFRLIRDVDFSEFDYVSFSDQDDVWLDDKLIAAHHRIYGNGYSGYSGNVTAFWTDGRSSLIDKAQKQRKYDFLFEAAGPGCSYVLKVSDAVIFKEFLIENWICVNEVSLHDWLIYAWFRSKGLSWFIDSVPKILYRQHDGNQVGANKGFSAMYSRLKLLRSGWYRAEIRKIARLVGKEIPELPSDIFKYGVVPRVFLISHLGEFRRDFRDRLAFIFLVMIGMY